MRRPIALLALAAVLGPVGGLLGGCSGSVGDDDRTIDSATLERKVSVGLGGSVGRAPDAVRCAHALKAVEGESTRCTLRDAGRTYGVTVTVDRVRGDRYHLDIQVDSATRS